MRPRWGAVLAFAVILLAPGTAAADEPRTPPPHIEAVRAFLVAWGHERWDDVKTVAADAVTVRLADQVFTLEPTAGTSEVAVRLPFRGLSTVRSGSDVTAVTVDELALRLGDHETRGPAMVTVTEDAGRFRVVGVSVDAAP